jgi:hypothetical protein
MIPRLDDRLGDREPTGVQATHLDPEARLRWGTRRDQPGRLVRPILAHVHDVLPVVELTAWLARAAALRVTPPIAVPPPAGG